MGRELYKGGAGNLQFGVVPGSKVAHMIEGDVEGAEFVNETEGILPEEQGLEVSQTELFSNKGEIKTREFFQRLAEDSERDYDIYYGRDSDMTNIMVCMKDYIYNSSYPYISAECIPDAPASDACSRGKI